ncbi:hypothetical protein SAMN06273572_10864 [Monaibacterium marinum]|uniref:Repeat domain-containing protein n=1 Tax=Pontivivens marinum TaxID=1690039 RepID=A0A2C9CUK0_9RHOB|nr:hypothetical protein [Monaibacterium marinum]SOH95191.1 hypothetical protein SAMN06273572_10864 [Monaibacterium marinum]
MAGNAQEVAFTQIDGRASYGHGVLGDIPEWHGLRVTDTDGQVAELVLPPDHIFEDIAPRVVQLDDDAGIEIVVVETRFNAGAALAVYEYAEGQLRLEARTHWFGRRNRWLAPIGIADLDGDGQLEIAYVETPHIGGTLRIWRLDGYLIEIASSAGHSNHQIGQNFIAGGIVECPEGPAIITADARWRLGRLTMLTDDQQLRSEPFPIPNGVLPTACP